MHDLTPCIAVLLFTVADISPVAVICLLLASLNSCTNPWVYLAFSGSLLNQMRVMTLFLTLVIVYVMKNEATRVADVRHRLLSAQITEGLYFVGSFNLRGYLPFWKLFL